MKDNLQKSVEKYNLIHRLWEAFWQTYDSYISEQPEESSAVGLINRSSIKAVVDCVFFKTFLQEDRSEIVVRIEIFNTDDKNIGYFDCIFDETGNDFDSYFIIY